MKDNLPYYLVFSHFLGIGPTRFNLLLNHFNSLEKAYKASLNDLKELLPLKIALKFVDFRNKFDVEKKIKEIQAKNITIVTREHKQFPPQLFHLSDSPICIYIKGDIDQYNFQEDFFFAIVGTRKPTSYGQMVAHKLATELALAGVTLVSGLAIGIDSLAHRAAVENNSKTVAFLGCGVDIVYPRENYQLYQEIIQKNGLIISEFPPGMMVMPGLFIARNRLISGLSQGILVVEGLKDSGSLITARFAAEQGKEVFAPPAPITSPLAEAPNLLLKEGAKIVTSVTDILEEFQIKVNKIQNSRSLDKLPSVEKNICEIILHEPQLADTIALQSKLPIQKVLSVLTTLEIQGIVEKNSEGKYQIKR